MDAMMKEDASDDKTAAVPSIQQRLLDLLF